MTSVKSKTMRNLLTLAIVSLLFTSCYDKGEITQEPTDFINIHGKVYKLMQVVPKDGHNPIWIMYPKDSLDKQPQVINYDEQSGKKHYTQTVIKVN